MSFGANRNGTGTREWSEYSFNIGKGCSHGCLYCYARFNACRYKIISNKDEWTTEVINKKAVEKSFGKRNGVIMFPTTHDITETYLEPSLIVLGKMLKAGNNVLIVSKPHLNCIMRICAELKDYKEHILFRFTIGTTNDNICKFWEPNAPLPKERIECLKYAFDNGFKTSVSMEPMLSGDIDAIRTFNAVKEFITDKVWIGKMNDINQRVFEKDDDEVKNMITMISVLQNDGRIISLYNALKNEEKVCWKDSIKKIVFKGVMP